METDKATGPETKVKFLRTSYTCWELKDLQDCNGADCEVTFAWVKRELKGGKMGRPMPLNTDFVEVLDNQDIQELRGKFVFCMSNTVRMALPGDAGPFFVSHFSTCPNAQDFRSGK